MRLAYYATAARNAGVPELWIEDAAQDIAIRVWRAGDPPYWKLVVRRAAIEAARRYGWLKRNERTYTPRARFISAADLIYEEAGYRDVERKADLERAWPLLKDSERRGILKAISPGKTTNLEQVRAYQGRKKLRRLCG